MPPAQGLEPGTGVLVVTAEENAAGSQRLRAAIDALRGLEEVRLAWLGARPATREEVERVHAPAYLANLERMRGFKGARAGYSVLPGSMGQVYLSAGAARTAVEEVCRGRGRRGFALSEPPGHHAEAERGMGFCTVNNVAVAVQHARCRLGLGRVLVVDWDVHHGNGTQHSFEETPEVLFFDVHQSPHFPGTGALEEVGRAQGRGATVNVPLPAGMTDGDYEAVFDELLTPLAERFRPELVVVSAGFDAHRDDSLGGMELTEDGFARLCATLRDLADRHAGGRLVLALEGGYSPPAVARCVCACVRVLDGAPAPAVRSGASPACRAVISRVQERHAAIARR